MTAVEWFDEQIQERIIAQDVVARKLIIEISMEDYMDIKKHANKMFEQQIIDAFDKAYMSGYRDNGDSGIDYFSEIYGSKGNDEPKEEPKLINNCPKCGLDLIIRENCTPICTDIDCRGIILSNETLREWASKKEPKQEPTSSQTEISDEEIGQKFKHYSDSWEIRQALEEGAKWYREQLKQINDKTNG